MDNNTTSPAEQLARALEAAGGDDFMVLRRMKPEMDFGPAPAGAVLARVIVIDTETTGLDWRTDKIIELAMLSFMVDTHTGLPAGAVEVYEDFEDPGFPITAEITEITGITDEMVKGRKLDDDRIGQMVAQADLIIAHNAGFDRPFSEARLPCFGAARWACSFKDINWTALGVSSGKLEYIATINGFFYEAHRATTDCFALTKILSARLPKSCKTGFAALLDAAATPSYKVMALYSRFEVKDKLKARGYRWDSEAKVWFCIVKSHDLLISERVWLRQNIYSSPTAHIDVEEIDARLAYSARKGSVARLGVGTASS